MPDKIPKGFVPDPPQSPAGFVPDSANVPDAIAQSRALLMSRVQPVPFSESPTTGMGVMPTPFGGAPMFSEESRRAIESARPGMIKSSAVGVGSALAPELLPEMAGGGLLGFFGRILARAGMSGVGAGAGNIAAQTTLGEDPLSRENALETAKIAGFTSALSVPLEAIGELAATKMGRGAINASMGGTARDMTYANPARALLREEIHDIGTGDWEAYQAALRSGKTPTEAAQAAGGRFAAVSQRINELTPRLGNLLNNSTAKIPVANVIDKPLEDAAIDIIKNPAMTDTEKMGAIGKLGELQKSLKEGLGADATPAQLQSIKQAVGNRVNWGGTSAITDDVKDAYRSVYGSLKQAIHRSVPGSADIDNRLTDLLGASSDLVQQAKAEEAGKIPFSVLRESQKEIGRILPAATQAPSLVPVGASIAAQLQSKGKPLPQVPPNTPGLPFHPGANQ